MSNLSGKGVGVLACVYCLFWGVSPVWSADWISIDGNVQSANGTPLCALVLANGQHMFSSDGAGTYNLKVPLDDSGGITLFSFADGFAPYRVTADPSILPSRIMMHTAPPGTPAIEVADSAECADAGGWANLYGSLTDSAGTPLCAMVLGNGEYMFSCGDYLGNYDLTVPIDEKQEVTLFAFADGFQPQKIVYDAEPCGSAPDGGDTLWVRVSHMGNTTWTIMGVPTGRMLLIDAAGASLSIEPYGCMVRGGSWKNYTYSAWKIAEVSRLSPDNIEMLCEATGSCQPEWARVDLPPGFRPVQYVAGCSTYMPFPAY